MRGIHADSLDVYEIADKLAPRVALMVFLFSPVRTRPCFKARALAANSESWPFDAFVGAEDSLDRPHRADTPLCGTVEDVVLLILRDGGCSRSERLLEKRPLLVGPNCGPRIDAPTSKGSPQ